MKSFQCKEKKKDVPKSMTFFSGVKQDKLKWGLQDKVLKFVGSLDVKIHGSINHFFLEEDDKKEDEDNLEDRNLTSPFFSPMLRN